MMDALVATLALVLSGFLLVPFLVRWPRLLAPVAVGWLLRCAFGTAQGAGLVELPDSQADARVFDQQALYWSDLNWTQLAQAFNPSESYVYSWVGAALYKLVGYNPLAFHAINIFLGSLLIILTYQLARCFSEERVALRSAWVAALFPIAILYSAILLREMMIVVPLMMGLIYTVRWVEQGSMHSLLLAGGAFGVASVFHGGVAVALAGLALVCLRESMGSLLRAVTAGYVKVRYLMTGGIAGMFLAASVLYALFGGVQLAAVGHTTESLSSGITEVVAYQSDTRAEGGSAYPDSVTNISFSNPVLSMPVMTTYFLFSPFPWDINHPNQLFGFLSNGMFLLLAFGLYRARGLIARNRAMQGVLMITVLLIVVFAFGTYNVGTAVRHREKVFFALLALCASPFLKSRLAWRWR